MKNILYIFVFATISMIIFSCSDNTVLEGYNENYFNLENAKSGVDKVITDSKTALATLQESDVHPSGNKQFYNAYVHEIGKMNYNLSSSQSVLNLDQKTKYQKIIENSYSPDDFLNKLSDLVSEEESLYLTSGLESNLDAAIEAYILLKVSSILVVENDFYDDAKAWSWECVLSVGAAAVVGGAGGCKIGAELGAFSLNPAAVGIGCGVVGVLGAVGAGLTAAATAC